MKRIILLKPYHGLLRGNTAIVDDVKAKELEKKNIAIIDKSFVVEKDKMLRDYSAK